jgi:hypothetical protein
MSLYKDVPTSLVDRYYELHPWEDSLKKYATKKAGGTTAYIMSLMGEETWNDGGWEEDITCVSSLRKAELRYNKCFVKNALYLIFGFVSY